MGKIQELTETLANQIAAGEVVERPASVVKELVENAIDAGSTQIDIFLEEAGLRKIQVTDNGEGIAPDDALNAFKRHATSKIHTRDDLFRIRSLGFRGEALPSIASVSELTLETSTGTGEGAFVYLVGGQVKEHRPHSLRKGTKITVENLFFNTPARLKYVKTLQTELANIGDIVNRLAMSHPDIAFRLVHDGNKMVTTLGNGDVKQAIAGVYGVGTAKKMIPIAKDDLDFSLSGYISLPELTRASRNYLSMIINGRYIKNFVLNKAVVEGYGSKLMVGRFPIAVLQITMDPLLVDVNVHPTKQEVRLSKEKELVALISSAIREALSQQQLIPSGADSVSFKKKVEQSPAATEQLRMPLGVEPPRKPSYPNQAFKQSGLAYDAKAGNFYVKEPAETAETASDQFNVAEAAAEPVAVPPLDKTEAAEAPSVPATEAESAASRDFPELEYFGQMHGTYLFAQSQAGLYIVDQHAAQERIKYEYYRKKIGDVGTDLQELLVPIVLDYPGDDALKIREHKDILETVGIFLEDFGQNSFVVRTHPVWYPPGEEEQVIRDMIDEFLMNGKVNVADFREATAIMMSCKKSIKANHYLDDQQARTLLDDLAQCENPYNCPHGRPVLIHFTNTDMEKLFKRIQDPH